VCLLVVLFLRRPCLSSPGVRPRVCCRPACPARGLPRGRRGGAAPLAGFGGAGPPFCLSFLFARSPGFGAFGLVVVGVRFVRAGAARWFLFSCVLWVTASSGRPRLVLGRWRLPRSRACSLGFLGRSAAAPGLAACRPPAPGCPRLPAYPCAAAPGALALPRCPLCRSPRRAGCLFGLCRSCSAPCLRYCAALGPRGPCASPGLVWRRRAVRPGPPRSCLPRGSASPPPGGLSPSVRGALSVPSWPPAPCPVACSVPGSRAVLWPPGWFSGPSPRCPPSAPALLFLLSSTPRSRLSAPRCAWPPRHSSFLRLGARLWGCLVVPPGRVGRLSPLGAFGPRVLADLRPVGPGPWAALLLFLFRAGPPQAVRSARLPPSGSRGPRFRFLGAWGPALPVLVRRGALVAFPRTPPGRSRGWAWFGFFLFRSLLSRSASFRLVAACPWLPARVGVPAPRAGAPPGAWPAAGVGARAQSSRSPPGRPPLPAPRRAWRASGCSGLVRALSSGARPALRLAAAGLRAASAASPAGLLPSSRPRGAGALAFGSGSSCGPGWALFPLPAVFGPCARDALGGLGWGPFCVPRPAVPCCLLVPAASRGFGAGVAGCSAAGGVRGVLRRSFGGVGPRLPLRHWFGLWVAAVGLAGLRRGRARCCSSRSEPPLWRAPGAVPPRLAWQAARRSPREPRDRRGLGRRLPAWLALLSSFLRVAARRPAQFGAVALPVRGSVLPLSLPIFLPWRSSGPGVGRPFVRLAPRRRRSAAASPKKGVAIFLTPLVF